MTTPSRTLYIYVLLLVSWLTGNAAMAQVNVERALWTAREALASDDYVGAIALLSRIIESRSNLPTPYYYRAYAKFSLDDYLGAETDCSLAIDRGPYETQYYLLRGLCRIHRDNYQGAIDDYSRVLTETPYEQGAIYNRALCRLQLKQLDDAATDLNVLMQKWPTWDRPYLVMSQVEMERGDTTKALACIDTLLASWPKVADAWSFKGRYALQKEQYALADSCLSNAIEYQANQYELYIARATARHALGRFGDAMEDYDKTIELVPEHFVAHYNRGLLRTLLGDNNRAIEDFDFVLQEEPDNTLARYNRALLYEKVGSWRAAIDDYSILIREYPNFIYGYYARASLRRRIGDVHGARNDETKVARAGLDLIHRPGAKRSTRKVRKRDDHSLDEYRKPIEETPDTARRYVSELMGKVQNRMVECTLLPPLRLTTMTTSTGGYHQAPFLPALENMNTSFKAKWPTPLSLSNRGMTQLPEDTVTVHQPAENTPAERIGMALWASARQADLCNYDAAIAELERVREALSLATPMMLQIYTLQYSAMAALTGGEWQGRALSVLNIALRKTPDNTSLLYNKGCVLHKLGKTQEAEQVFIKILEKDHQFAEGHYNLGVIYLLDGAQEKALPHLSIAGELGLYAAYSLMKSGVKLPKNP